MPQFCEGRLILVRHGETEANRLGCFASSDDIPLTETGRLQARAVALRLAREFHPEVLVSSTFVRARQTSEIIAETLGLVAEPVEGIHERNFGCLKGHPYARLGELLSLENGLALTPWLWRPPGGESLEDVRERAIGALEGIRARYPGRELVAVCHGAVIQAVCAHLQGDWAEASVPPNCGILTVDLRAKTWTLHNPVT